MENTIETEGFDVKSTIEQTTFVDSAVQSFFGKWCEINDGIRPEFVDRNTWEERGGMETLLDPASDGKKSLSIPNDLHLWEMVGVMEAVDKETFIGHPEKQAAKKDEIINLGKVFEKAGIYIAQRVDFIDQGRKIAGNLATQFYDYGVSLATGEKPEYPSSTEFLQGLPTIPQEELEEVDRWLAGDRFYADKREKLDKVLAGKPEKRDALFEAVRREKLAQYFRIAEEAFERTGENEDGSVDRLGLHTWETSTSIKTSFIDKQNTQMQRVIEAPKREFVGSIFRRGMELLRHNMPFEKLPDETRDTFLAWQNGEKTLREALKIDDKKEELNRIRETGDIAKIAEAELNFALDIQDVVSRYPKSEGANNPTQILKDETINCVGASLLGGSLLSELGINYLVATIPGHSSLFLVTSDSRVGYFDMLMPESNQWLREESIIGQKNDGTQFMISDIADFSNNPATSGLRFGLQSTGPNAEALRSIHVFEPTVGHQLQVLHNTILKFSRNGFDEEVIEASKQIIALNPNSGLYQNLGSSLNNLGRAEEAVEVLRRGFKVDPHVGYLEELGRSFSLLGRNEEAIQTYQQAITLGLDSVYIHNVLGDIFRESKRSDEAIAEYNKVIALDPTTEYPYFWLGIIYEHQDKKDEAIKSFRKVIELSNPDTESEIITQAEQRIEELEK